MKIGVLHPYALDSSGSGFYAASVCDRLADAGHEVTSPATGWTTARGRPEPATRSGATAASR